MNTQTRQLRVLLLTTVALFLFVVIWVSPVADLGSYRDSTEEAAGLLLPRDPLTVTDAEGALRRSPVTCIGSSGDTCTHVRHSEDAVEEDSDVDARTRVSRGVIWTPGGVVGRTALRTQQYLDELFERIVKTELEQGVAAMCHDGIAGRAPPVTGAPRTGKSKSAAATTRAVLAKLIAALVPDGLVQEDDCRLHLAAHHRAMCLATAMLDDSDCGGDNERTDGGTATRRPSEKDASENRTTSRKEKAKRTFVPLRDRCVYRHSLCAQFATCVWWTRGRFTQRLTPSVLAEVYDRHVTRRAASTRSAFCATQKQFLHGEVGAANCSEHRRRVSVDARLPLPERSASPKGQSTNITSTTSEWTADAAPSAAALYDNLRSSPTASGFGVAVNRLEYGWLKRRLLASEAHVNKNYNIRAAYLSRLVSRGSNRSRTALLPESLEASPMRDVFQGKVVSTLHVPLIAAAPTSAVETVPVLTAEVEEATRRAAEMRDRSVEGKGSSSSAPHVLEYFSPLETVALLWRKCQTHSAPIEFGHAALPRPCVILFNGDSLTREVFNRLVLHIRYGTGSLKSADEPLSRRDSRSGGDAGGARPRLSPTSFLPTHVEVGNTFDIVYRVFPTHDELIYLYGEMSFAAADGATNHTETAELSRWTLKAYLDELHEKSAASEHRKHWVGDATVDVPLFHIVFCWDHLTQAPRAGPFAGSTRLLSALAPQANKKAKTKMKSKQKNDRRGSLSQQRTAVPRPSFDRGIDFEEPLLTRYPNVVIPLQIFGMTFWQKVMHPNLLKTLLDMSALHRRLSGGTLGERPMSKPEPKHEGVMKPLDEERKRDPTGVERPSGALCTFQPPFRTRCTPPVGSHRGPLYVMTPFTHDPLHPDFRVLLPELDFSAGVAPSEASCPDIAPACLRSVAKKDMRRLFQRQEALHLPGLAGGAADSDEDNVDPDTLDTSAVEPAEYPKLPRNASGSLADEVVRLGEEAPVGSPLVEGSDVPLVDEEQERQEQAADEADGDDDDGALVAALLSSAMNKGNVSGWTPPKSRKCRLYNVAKTLEWFRFLELLLAHRKRLFWSRAATDQSKGDTGNRGIPPPVPWLHSFALFDKAKAQFSGLPVGDARHFSCHARTTRKYRRRDFHRSLQRESIEDVLAPIFLSDAVASRRFPEVSQSPKDVGAQDIRVVPHSRRRTLCGQTLSVAALAEWFEKAMRGRTRRVYRSLKFDTIPLIGLHGTVVSNATLAEPLQHAPKKHAEASIGRRFTFFSNVEPWYRADVDPLQGNRSSQQSSSLSSPSASRARQGTPAGWTVSSSSPPKDFLAMRNNGADRCQNSGDLFLIHLMLMDWYWKQESVG